MNFFKSRSVIGNLIGQWRKQVVETGSRRSLCIKPAEAKPELPAPVKPGPPLAVPAAPAPHSGFRIPGYKPSNWDKKMLLWSGRFKTADKIPELVSFDMIDAARNKVRVKVCYGMMVGTMAACLVMVILGKRAAGRHETLTGQNMEKKARWREDYQREREAAAAAAALEQKPQ